MPSPSADSSKGEGGLEAVLFDFDGTILDTESAILATWSEEYRLAGKHLAPDDWAAHAGRQHVDHYAILSDLVGPTFDAEACRVRRRQHQRELLKDVRPRPGILEALSFCTENLIRTAIVSSSPREWVAGQLRGCGITHRFDAMVCREDVTVMVTGTVSRWFSAALTMATVPE